MVITDTATMTVVVIDANSVNENIVIAIDVPKALAL